MESKSEIIIVSNNKIYDLSFTTRKSEDETYLEISIHPETETIYFYKFNGTITNLIDQDKQWRKFEIFEVEDILKDNIDNKTYELETTEDHYILSLQIVLNNKKSKYSIKLTKTLKDEDLVLKSDSDTNLLNLHSKILGLTQEIKKSKINKTQIIYDMPKNSHSWLPQGRKEYPFDFTIKNSGNIEFIVNVELNQAHGLASWLYIDLEWENSSSGEKGIHTLYNKHFYATESTQSGYYNLPTIKASRIEVFLKGFYKMKLVLHQNSGGSIFLLNYIKLFSKNR
jgi:hypothetical protein